MRPPRAQTSVPLIASSWTFWAVIADAREARMVAGILGCDS
jgi:hypothetical protein